MKPTPKQTADALRYTYAVLNEPGVIDKVFPEFDAAVSHSLRERLF